jgi:FKBP-type peptidyl-prolyl cis-trans isomerase FkpA
MNKNLLVIAIGLLSSFVFYSCSSSDIEGYEKNEDGLYYKFFKQTENGTHAKADDQIHFKFLLKIKSTDSVLADTRKVRAENGVVSMQVRPSSFKGSLEDGIMMMSPGDSASFIINADSFYLKTQSMQKLPPFIKPGEKLVAFIKLEKIVEAKVAMENEKKRNDERMQQMQAMEMQSKTDLEKYIVENKITTKPTESGLYYIELKKGNGPKIQLSDTVMFYYKGSFLNGEVFEENTKDPEPLTYPAGQLIPGWVEALQKMNVGGKAKLICPYTIAYGPQGGGKIPPFSNLVFELEVKGVNPGSKK